MKNIYDEIPKLKRTKELAGAIENIDSFLQRSIDFSEKTFLSMGDESYFTTITFQRSLTKDEKWQKKIEIAKKANESPASQMFPKGLILGLQNHLEPEDVPDEKVDEIMFNTGLFLGDDEASRRIFSRIYSYAVQVFKEEREIAKQELNSLVS